MINIFVSYTFQEQTRYPSLPPLPPLVRLVTGFMELEMPFGQWQKGKKNRVDTDFLWGNKKYDLSSETGLLYDPLFTPDDERRQLEEMRRRNPSFKEERILPMRVFNAQPGYYSRDWGVAQQVPRLTLLPSARPAPLLPTPLMQIDVLKM